MFVSHLSLTLFFVLMLNYDDVIGCSMPLGWRPQSPVEKLYNANQALYGRVIDKKRDTDRMSEVYTVTFEVYCILKGERSPEVVEITNVGNIPGMCWPTDLDVGQEYVLLVWPLNTPNDHFMILERFPVQSRSQLATFAYACGVQEDYPYGVEPSLFRNRPKCPKAAPSNECFDAGYFQRQYEASSWPRQPSRRRIP